MEEESDMYKIFVLNYIKSMYIEDLAYGRELRFCVINGIINEKYVVGTSLGTIRMLIINKFFHLEKQKFNKKYYLPSMTGIQPL